MSILTEIWITSNSFFSYGVSLRTKDFISPFFNYFHTVTMLRVLFGNFIFAFIAQMFCS